MESNGSMETDLDVEQFFFFLWVVFGSNLHELS